MIWRIPTYGLATWLLILVGLQHAVQLKMVNAQQMPGEFIDAFISSKLPRGLDDLVFGPDGHLYAVSLLTDSILRYDGQTGEFIDTFIQDLNIPGSPTFQASSQLEFGPDGHLYFSNYSQRVVYRYDGTMGTFIDIFVQDTTDITTFTSDLEFGPDGHLYLFQRQNDAIFRYDGTTGARIDTFIVDVVKGISNSISFEFGPDGHLYIASKNTNEVLRFDGTTGEFIDTFVPKFRGGLVAPTSILFGPDSTLYVTSEGSNEILRYDSASGEFIDILLPHDSAVIIGPEYLIMDKEERLYVSSRNAVYKLDRSINANHAPFLSPQHGGLNRPHIMELGPDNLLYVAHFGSELLRFDVGSGAFVDTFITSRSGGLLGPAGMAFGPDNQAYISSYSGDEVIRYNGSTGEFIDVFITLKSGGLEEPRDLVFRPDSLLYVISGATDQVLRFNASTGEFVDVFISQGSGGLESPLSMAFSEDGFVYISSLTKNDIWRFNSQNGAFIDIVASLPRGASGTIGSMFRSLTIGPYGNLFATRQDNHEVFQIDLSLEGTVSSFIPSKRGGLTWASDILFGPDNNAYVSSSLTNEILRFKGPNPTQTSIQTEEPVAPKTITHSLFPNPVSNLATLTYTLPNPTRITINVYDISGRHIQQVLSKNQSAGPYSLDIDTHSYPSGLYFYHIKAGDFQDIGRFVRVK